MVVVTVGGAYAVIAYVALEAVEGYGWLRADQTLVGPDPVRLCEGLLHARGPGFPGMSSRCATSPTALVAESSRSSATAEVGWFATTRKRSSGVGTRCIRFRPPVVAVLRWAKRPVPSSIRKALTVS